MKLFHQIVYLKYHIMYKIILIKMSQKYNFNIKMVYHYLKDNFNQKYQNRIFY